MIPFLGDGEGRQLLSDWPVRATAGIPRWAPSPPPRGTLPSPCRIFPTSSLLLLGVAGVGGGAESCPALPLLVPVLLSLLCVWRSRERIGQGSTQAPGGWRGSLQVLQTPGSQQGGGRLVDWPPLSFIPHSRSPDPPDLKKEATSQGGLGSWTCSFEGRLLFHPQLRGPPASPAPKGCGHPRAQFVRAGALRAPRVRVWRVGLPCAAQT